jgi:hypothetical protein
VVELLPELPVALEEILVEQTQSDNCLIESRWSELLLVPAEDQVIEDLPLSQLLECALRVVLGQLPNLPEVLGLGTSPQ